VNLASLAATGSLTVVLVLGLATARAQAGAGDDAFEIAEKQAEALEAQQVERGATLGSTDGSEDEGMVHSDPSVSAIGPDFLYITQVRDHVLSQFNQDKVDIEIWAWNASAKTTAVRVQGHGWHGPNSLVYEEDRILAAGERGVLVNTAHVDLVEGGASEDVRWIVIASDAPLLVFGDVDRTFHHSVWTSEDCAASMGWAAKRTLEIREVTCQSAPSICALIDDETPWPSVD
jgi:hypothetical protein